jgi:hypothetical protein
VVTRIDRLARSVADLQDIVRTLRARGASLKATEQPVDTSTAAGKAFLDMLSVFPEFETAIRRERQLEGIAKAKAEGRYKTGRPRKPEIQKRARGIGPALPRRSASAGRPSTTSSVIPSPAGRSTRPSWRRGRHRDGGEARTLLTPGGPSSAPAHNCSRSRQDIIRAAVRGRSGRNLKVSYRGRIEASSRRCAAVINSVRGNTKSGARAFDRNRNQPRRLVADSSRQTQCAAISDR